MFRAFVHPEIQLFLDSEKKIKNERKPEQLFVFPWGTASTTANHEFWLALLGRDSGSRGWLGDVVCNCYKHIVRNDLAAGVSYLTSRLLQFLNDSILDYGLIF